MEAPFELPDDGSARKGGILMLPMGRRLASVQKLCQKNKLTMTNCFSVSVVLFEPLGFGTLSYTAVGDAAPAQQCPRTHASPMAGIHD